MITLIITALALAAGYAIGRYDEKRRANAQAVAALVKHINMEIEAMDRKHTVVVAGPKRALRLRRVK